MPNRSLPKSRIFISHSAHEPHAKDVLNNLIKRLEVDFDVLCDKERLIAGQEWRDELFTWMHQAHSAIILFSASALESDWVRTEASVLTWRLALDRGKTFRVIPVLLDPVAKKDLDEKRFSPMRLTTLQLVRTNDLSQIVDEVSTGLRHLLKSRPPETPFEKLERKVAHVLRDIDEAELLDAARAMDMDVSQWDDSTAYPGLLAAEMLRHGLPLAIKALRVLDDFLGPDDTSTLIELIAPAWVNQHAASGIPQMAMRDDAAPRLLWVNGGDDYPEFTANHFIRRACCRTPNTSWPVLPVTNESGEDEIGYYKRAIRESIKSKVVKVEDAKDSLVQSVLQKRERDKEPVFVVFYPPGPSPDVIAALRKEFPTITYFILTGNRTASGVPGRLPTDIDLLQPELGPDDEAEAYSEYVAAIGYNR